MRFCQCFAASIVFYLSSNVCASFLDGQSSFGGNVYQVYSFDASDPDKTWNTANSIATGLTFGGTPGHLATLLSAAENDFVYSLRSQSGVNQNGGQIDSELWIGGFQLPGSAEPADGWTWVNGEGAIPGTNAGPGYANWEGGEPNDLFNSEDYLAIGRSNLNAWNDEGTLLHIYGFVVEYDGAAAAVPEPSTFAVWGLLGLTLSCVCWRRRRRKG